MLLSIDKEKEELTCNTCHTILSLKKDNLYGICSCKNIKLVYCKNHIHITVNSVNKDHWYEYELS